MKQTFTVRLDRDILERARNAIWALGNRTTLTDILATALAQWVQEQETTNGGKPFPEREGELPYSPKKR